jgi:hypothetical protein
MKSFLQYDKENPQIYKRFAEISEMYIKRGYKHIGAKSICETIRWETFISGNDDFKINNNYISGYARKFEIENPEHLGLFRKRLCKLK